MSISTGSGRSPVRAELERGKRCYRGSLNCTSNDVEPQSPAYVDGACRRPALRVHPVIIDELALVLPRTSQSEIESACHGSLRPTSVRRPMLRCVAHDGAKRTGRIRAGKQERCNYNRK